MSGWRKLEEPEYTHIWDYVYDGLGFHPSTAFSHWPGFREPTPSVTFKLSSPWVPEEVEEFYEVMWEALKSCSPPGKEIYSLDWHHECFTYDPHAFPPPPQELQFTRGLYPNGDYGITLSHDLSWGVLGHPWEFTICIFGQPLLNVIEKNPPKLFRHIIRRDGWGTTS